MEVASDFEGAYYVNIMHDVSSDKIYYLTNDLLDSLSSYNYETKRYNKLYDLEKINSIDKYDIFLSGPVSIIEVNNDDAINDKTLIVFRDSFASSIAPLLAMDVKKLVLIDTRYINSDLLGNYVDFNNADILFMYSCDILNNSFSFKW